MDLPIHPHPLPQTFPVAEDPHLYRAFPPWHLAAAPERMIKELVKHFNIVQIFQNLNFWELSAIMKCPKP